MLVEQTKAEVTNVNSRPEGSGEGMAYASDLSLTFSVPRAVIDALVPSNDSYTAQFYAGDDTILEALYPQKWNKRIDGLRATIEFDDDKLTFEPCRIQSGMEWTPQAGEFVKVVCKLQVHPATPTESGRLDFLAKRWIDIALEPLNRDIDDGR